MTLIHPGKTEVYRDGNSGLWFLKDHSSGTITVFGENGLAQGEVESVPGLEAMSTPLILLSLVKSSKGEGANDGTRNYALRDINRWHILGSYRETCQEPHGVLIKTGSMGTVNFTQTLLTFQPGNDRVSFLNYIAEV